MPGWVYLVVAILAEVMATTALKASDGMTRWVPAIVVVAGYGLAFFCLALSMRHFAVGIVYAIWAGAGIVLISMVGWLWFGEKPDLAAFVGMGLILSGVLVLNLLSTTSAH
ncbi:DMT family transporter [Parathalassolituus penaei]|uniref:Multidrug efflux SMR transporter n=1 Tax=Parathalassolituus penaei TaxID=2997323 RepID=A0A9X3IR25_9GAMM|nr:multidrug efflux SMR transporter [Parathalassolituus penaei]MCY0963785.1 multidrug efflux SMR transporter [Parathalassolituus penaei]